MGKTRIILLSHDLSSHFGSCFEPLLKNSKLIPDLSLFFLAAVAACSQCWMKDFCEGKLSGISEQFAQRSIRSSSSSNN
jgi:hypothetical protein